MVAYPESVIEVDPAKSYDQVEKLTQTPFTWRLDNPYFGKTFGSYNVPKFLDWLYIMPKIINDRTHLIVYIVPEEKMIDSKGQKIPSAVPTDKSIAIYSSHILKVTDMRSFTLERQDFTSYPRKSRISSF